MLTSTEFDAIAVNQATSYPAISLPLGTNSLPPEVCTLYLLMNSVLLQASSLPQTTTVVHVPVVFGHKRTLRQRRPRSVYMRTDIT